ncbi:hypothetical protein Sulku_0586 [Sulfuricurvum kujiense DSM 16994]|uniref:Glutathionylspermidine synthase pre-ATP-grasp-like domain-containing protein n=1 Tax=Sulfuricurvum kujiense (strain ATCC BAA-921 / DSM 16994 / JCM 11577 / YK-1) TaxID=709032 RepID=E4U0F5_SULKY|nr:hypothetical protein [Sulfuricurvum kujiense]ADR33252.1 hypothetical protein Sulku_0586 [Sulfuricurvum kujiense DSM 16994]
MLINYQKYYRENFTPERYKAYQADFEKEVGKLYAISTGPYFLRERNAQKIRESILPALMKFLGSSEYQERVYERGWFLPKFPIEKKDFFGSADFHIDGDEIRLIELNFFLPGHFGLVELFPKLFSKNFDMELEVFAEGFEVRLAKFLKERFGGDKIALSINHLGLSVHYFEHYKYIENFLNKNGVRAKVVYAKDAGYSDTGKAMWDGEEFDGVFNIVIPRIWEHNPEEFKNYTDLFHKTPESFFPNPWCWTIGDKRFLNDLSALEKKQHGLSDDEIAALQSVTLKSASLKDFSSVHHVCSFFGGRENLVLKPIDNYHTQGVFIEPSIEQIEEIFSEKADIYIAQECFNAEIIYYENENKEAVEPWRSQLRVEFFNGEFSNFRSYGFSDPFGLSPMMPVVIVK